MLGYKCACGKSNTRHPTFGYCPYCGGMIYEVFLSQITGKEYRIEKEAKIAEGETQVCSLGSYNRGSPCP